MSDSKLRTQIASFVKSIHTFAQTLNHPSGFTYGSQKN